MKILILTLISIKMIEIVKINHYSIKIYLGMCFIFFYK